MSCCSCFTFERRKVHDKKGESELGDFPDVLHDKNSKIPNEAGKNNTIQAQAFTFRELAAATKNFRQETLLGEGGFGRVYKGQLGKTKQTVAVKQLDRSGMQGNKEFLVEVLMLSLLRHPNLANLIGYCADGDQRLLVYEFMPLGSLENHLLDLKPDVAPLDWFTRLKIALGAARGLEYLHDKAKTPVIFRDLKSSNILLDKEYNAKLSDFGLAKQGTQGDKTQISSRVMGTYGYCAPEYQRTGQLTLMSDVYSFGVVLLEIITGRRAMDPTRNIKEQNLVSWAEPYFGDQSKYPELADPLLEGNYPIKSLNQVVAMASMCLQEEASVRPLIGDVVTALSFLGQGPEEQEEVPPQPDSVPTPREPTPMLVPKRAPPDPPSQPALATNPPQPDPVLVPPQPVPAPTYDIVPQPDPTPVSAPATEGPSPSYEQYMVDLLTPAQASTATRSIQAPPQSDPALPLLQPTLVDLVPSSPQEAPTLVIPQSTAADQAPPEPASAIPQSVSDTHTEPALAPTQMAPAPTQPTLPQTAPISAIDLPQPPPSEPVPSQAIPASTQKTLVLLEPSPDPPQTAPTSALGIPQPLPSSQVPPQAIPALAQVVSAQALIPPKPIPALLQAATAQDQALLLPRQSALGRSQTAPSLTSLDSPPALIIPPQPAAAPSHTPQLPPTDLVPPRPMHNDDQVKNAMTIDSSMTSLEINQNNPSLWTSPSIIV